MQDALSRTATRYEQPGYIHQLVYGPDDALTPSVRGRRKSVHPAYMHSIIALRAQIPPTTDYRPQERPETHSFRYYSQHVHTSGTVLDRRRLIRQVWSAAPELQEWSPLQELPAAGGMSKTTTLRTRKAASILTWKGKRITRKYGWREINGAALRRRPEDGWKMEGTGEGGAHIPC